jgi:hypothetical protein
MGGRNVADRRPLGEIFWSAIADPPAVLAGGIIETVNFRNMIYTSFSNNYYDLLHIDGEYKKFKRNFSH